ncbi:MAG TPA: glycoside hydrolase family 127 protein, partial [Phycisphaerae bacterium]|nr:glycoside hydrolase family 127 protein [Phycisphaerae bacterium]
TSHGEAFGGSFELPNATSYAETCAAIANAMWNWRLLAATGEARFADEMERVFYNGFLSGVSLGGADYFYVNPLESAGGHKRVPWFDCTCCPTNVVRTFAAIPGYVYSTSPEGLWVHLYDNNELNWRLEDGRKLRLTQETHYPWDGRITLTVSPESDGEFSLFLRIPGWCTDAKVSVNGQPADAAAAPGSYCRLKRTWHPGDTVTLELPLPVAVRTCDPRVRNNRGRMAIQRGPVVYCLESVDNPGVDVLSVLIPIDAKSGGLDATVAFQADRLGGVCEVRFEGIWPDYSVTSGPLYRSAAASGMPAVRRAKLTAIPYYAWANRGDSQMIVWVPFLAAPGR